MLISQGGVSLKVCVMQQVVNKVDWMLRKCSSIQMYFICLVLIALIAWVDIAAGYEISVSIFFLLPIAIATWYGSQRASIIYSIGCATLWFFMDTKFSAHQYINPLAPYWNGTVRLGFFLIAVGLLGQLKYHLTNEIRRSRTDDLTNLCNVRGFTEQAEILFGLAVRHGRSVVLAYIDLDNFKQVNDNFGHSEGDKVLSVVGKKISSSLRVTDVAGRVGGDEFVIVLPETDEYGAKSVLNKLRGTLFQETQKHGWPISFSVGVVSFSPSSHRLDEAIKIADSLMYQVKASGKNNILFKHCTAA